MDILILGLIIFFTMHLVPSFTSVRNKLIARLGEGPYMGLYSIVSLAGLILIIYGKSQAEFHAIWNPPVWSRHLVITFMLVSFILFAGADMKSNFKCYTRHPMLWGVTIWAGTHLSANGDLASILLFGSFFVFALFDMLSANIRGATKQEIKYPYSKDAIAVIAGIVAYVVFVLFLHPYLIGVPII